MRRIGFRSINAVSTVVPAMKLFIRFILRRCASVRASCVAVAVAAVLLRISASGATVTWSGAGGDDLWSNPANWNGGVLPTALDDVIIDMPGEVTVRMDVANTTVRSLQCEESFVIQNGPFAITNGTSVVNGTFAISAGQYAGFTLFEAKGAGTTFTVNGAVTNLVGLNATDGATMSFPGAHDVAAAGSSSWYTTWMAGGAGSAIHFPNLTNITSSLQLDITAFSGGEIDLGALRTSETRLNISAQGSNSLINLAGLSGLFSGSSIYQRKNITANDGGTVHIPNVTGMEFVLLNLGVGSIVPTAQLRSFTSGELIISSRTNGFDGLTNFSGSISASQDSRLDWGYLTTLYPSNSSDINISVSGNSVIDLSGVTNAVIRSVSAQGDGRIDLRNLGIEAELGLVSASGNGSQIDLSGLVGQWKGIIRSQWPATSLQAGNGGSVLIPNVTALRDVSLSLDGGSFVPTAQLGSIVGGSMSLAARTNGFDGLTNFSANLSAANSRLDLTNLTVLYVTNAGNNASFSASQGSFIDLSRVTNVVTFPGRSLGLGTFDNSRIDLSGLRFSDAQISAGAYGGLIDLSGLSGSWEVKEGNGSLNAFSGGTIATPNVTAMKGVSLYVTGDGGLDLSRIESIVDGNISLTDCTNNLSALTNFSGSLAANNAELILTNLTTLHVTNRNNYFFTAERGGILNLSNVTKLVAAPNSRTLILDASRSGGGRIDLSGLTEPYARLSVTVAGQRGVVDLSGIQGVWTGPGGANVSSDGTLLIPNVTALDGVGLSINAGHVPLSQLQSFVNGTLNLGQRTNVFSSLTNFQGSMNCNYLGRAEFLALTQLVTTNGFVQFTAPGGYIDLSQVTNAIVKTHALNISASSGGYVDLSNLETIVAGNVGVTASGADAVVDLSGLTGFFSENNEGRFSTSSGGVILLNADAMLISGVAFDFQSNPGGPVPPFSAAARELVLYGQPWRSYRIEARNPAEAGSPWRSYLPRVALTDSLLSLGARPPRDLILRVYSFIADPPEVDLRRGASGTLETILFGKPESHYRLESTVNPGSGGWQEVLTTTLTNSFHILPAVRATNTARFYRGLEL